MVNLNLDTFIGANREEIILRCRTKVANDSGGTPSDADQQRGVPLFLDQLRKELDTRLSQTREIRRGALEHGESLFFEGFTVQQVVHAYGNVCQAITDLAVELKAPIEAAEFRTLNRCLDDAIAGAVSAYTQQQRVANLSQTQELRAMAEIAITVFEVLQTGSVGVTGTSGTLLHRTLLAIRTRLEASALNPR